MAGPASRRGRSAPRTRPSTAGPPTGQRAGAAGAHAERDEVGIALTDDDARRTARPGRLRRSAHRPSRALARSTACRSAARRFRQRRSTASPLPRRSRRSRRSRTDPRAAQPAALAASIRRPLEAGPVGNLQRIIEVVGEVAGVVHGPGSSRIRHLRRPDEVAPADLVGRKAELARRLVHQPLDDIGSPPAGRRRGRHRSARCWYRRRGKSHRSPEWRRHPIACSRSSATGSPARTRSGRRPCWRGCRREAQRYGHRRRRRRRC